MTIDHTDPLLEGDPWVEHPEFPLADWQYDVANNDTRLGYQDWVIHQQEAEDATVNDEWMDWSDDATGETDTEAYLEQGGA